MSAPTQQPTIAFIGATGGATIPALASALLANHHCTALARNPSKLRDLLIDGRKVPAALVDSHLTIVGGSASSAAAMRALLAAPHAGPKALVSFIVSGIGSLPKMQLNPLKPVTLQDPHVCETAVNTATEALRGLLAEGYRAPGAADGRPAMVVISTTGVSRIARDVPVACMPGYHWLLAVPHVDKRAMEDRVVAATKGADATLRGFVAVRPSLLIDGEGKGLASVKVGWEGAEKGADGAPGPAIGYAITREDVGAWIWEEAVLKNDKWANKCVSLTY
ncbi:hypothetical protein UCRNP2_2752 [Neofusicoccum parvum UCRNP2]|uniref:NAD(P)-binding domain-containing protein n=1 Tax=Botryosphaeria parva (strain UCR-NP2) TaxID=1287680 RepID=R1GFV5_BOTPV|nr:hypothetical protein UCRNP2_2752 [Neofusicoccum parvum UCRNP2]